MKASAIKPKMLPVAGKGVDLYSLPNFSLGPCGRGLMGCKMRNTSLFLEGCDHPKKVGAIEII